LLHQWGVLDTLYTDFYAGNSWPTHILRNSKINSRLPAAAKRALDRYDPALDQAKIVHFPRLGYQYAKSLKQLRGQSGSSIFVKTGQNFCQRIIHHGLGDADTVYGFNGACLELFQYAKSQGLRCILDQTLAERKYYYTLLQEETNCWADWVAEPFSLTDADLTLAAREQQEQDLADQIICGSDFVKHSLVARGVPADKITVIPLGRAKLHRKLPTQRPLAPWQDRKDGLHILFAGSVGLRKGIPYLLEALRQINGEVPFLCKAAGNLEVKAEKASEYSDVCHFLGRVPRSEMASLYQWADVFVLPSLCEGSAMVTYEALQYGLPIIVTQNTGSIIRDGIDGWIIPIQDAGAISKSLIDFSKKGHCSNFFEKLSIHYEQSHNDALDKFKDVALFQFSDT
jgi:glycosyltransferase involved in cell wall biosynthesis